MEPGFSWSRVLAGAETRQLQGRVGVGSQSCPVEEEKDGVEDCEHSWLSWTNPCNNPCYIGIHYVLLSSVMSSSFSLTICESDVGSCEIF